MQLLVTIISICLYTHTHTHIHLYINIYIYILSSEAADKVSGGDGKFEQLVICAQEIAASTAQLTVSSKVKADKTSPNIIPLSDASKRVTECTASVVASARSCAQLIEDQRKYGRGGLWLCDEDIAT